jgi:hypothetical protein
MKTVTNFMNGKSYESNPLSVLKMIAASSVFGEASFYIDNRSNKIANLKKVIGSPYLKAFTGCDTVEAIMEKAIDKSLSWNFKSTIEYALELRTDFNMRLNPQVIFVRACVHPDRVEFDKTNPGILRSIGYKIMHRADDPVWQYQYYKYLKGNTHNIPNVMKRTWTDKLSKLSSYEISKYKNIAGKKELINVARLANTKKIRSSNESFNTFMETGTLEAKENEITWEKYISENGSNEGTWSWVVENIFQRNGKPSNHMALVRNLHNIEIHIKNDTILYNVAKLLIDGVPYGKQFPFRYYSALKHVDNPILKEALNSCFEKAIENFPKLEGKTICLCDNSGSAWGAVTSEYGTVTVAEIANLSSILTARCSTEESKIAIFGDNLEYLDVSDKTINDQLTKSVEIGQEIGHSTELGVWTFWNDAIINKTHYDNIFIYSDMQAGHGELYGNFASSPEYGVVSKRISGNLYIDLQSLINKYRQEVNQNVNVFSVQVAGYSNTILPELDYRCSILSGWTGKEALYAKEMINAWNEFDTSCELE